MERTTHPGLWVKTPPKYQFSYTPLGVILLMNLQIFDRSRIIARKQTDLRLKSWRNRRENHGKSWKIMENHGSILSGTTNGCFQIGGYVRIFVWIELTLTYTVIHVLSVLEFPNVEPP
jgi:hypothetical protein